MSQILDIRKRATGLGKQRALVLAAGAVAASVLALTALTAPASAATIRRTYDLGRGSCLLRDMGSLGSGGNSTITAPATRETSDWRYRVIAKRWTIVVHAVTGARLAEHYQGKRWLAPFGANSYPESTVDIPPRTSADDTPVKVQLVSAYYNPRTGALLEVDTGTASSYWIYKNGGFRVFKLRLPAISC
jgi:hypothetical protein